MKIRKLHRKGIYQHLQRKTTISTRRKVKFKTNREEQELNNYNWELVAKEFKRIWYIEIRLENVRR